MKVFPEKPHFGNPVPQSQSYEINFSNNAWGVFQMPIKVVFINKAYSPIQITHDMCFFGDGLNQSIFMDFKLKDTVRPQKVIDKIEMQKRAQEKKMALYAKS